MNLTNDAMAAVKHRRRAGTSGIAGQLYEVKMAMLALLNAQLAKKRGNVDKFWLGSNIDGLGVADDLVIKYTIHEHEKLSFVQFKHRDNLKNKVTLGDVLKEDGDFALIILLDSYLSVIHKCSATDDIVLNDANENIEIIMYTPAETSFEDKTEEIKVDRDDFILTNENGRVVQFKKTGDHIDILLETMSRSHGMLVAKLLANFVLSGNGANLMMNYIIQMYHVYISKYILQVSDSIERNTRKVKFRRDFFYSEDSSLSQLKKLLCNEILTYKKRCKIIEVNLKELEIILSTISVEISNDEIEKLRNKSKKQKLFINEIRDKLKELNVSSSTVDKILTEVIMMKLCEMRPITVPNTFGNVDLEIRKERRLDHISKQIVKILQNSEITNDDGKVCVENKHVGRNRILTRGDVQVNGGIAGLVGNVLILDENTNMLKINDDENSLPDNAKKFLSKLKNTILKDNLNIDLSNYRFHFDVLGFPRLLWGHRKADRNLLVDFLNKFKFYSCQSKEEELATIIQKQMIKYYNTDLNIYKTFLDVQDKIQAWWREKDEGIYLTETCNYFDAVDKPDLLHTFKFIHSNDMTNQDIIFCETALHSLDIEHFITQTEFRILNIVTNNLSLSTIKLLQYFKSNDSLCYNYCIIDMQYVLKNNLYDDMLNELQKTQIKNIIIRSIDFDFHQYTFCNEIQNIEKIFFIITQSKVIGAPIEICNYIQDKTIRFTDLSEESQLKLLTYRISFQGEEIKLKELLINKECVNLIDANILYKIMIKENIMIGKPLADKKYNTIKNLYIDRKLDRYVTIKKNFIRNPSTLNENIMKNLIVTNSKHIRESNIELHKDILLISNNIKEFEELCMEYKHHIHWFQKNNKNFIWKKSRGYLNNIRNYTEIDERRRNNPLINTLSDVEEKTVIIAAGPGMGKTCLLTHLSIATKKMHPSTWIMRINLLDHSNKFSEWHDNDVDIDEKEALKFLSEIVRNQSEVDTSTDSDKQLAVFEEQLFDQYYKSGNIALIFDGYDEISPDYKDQADKLLINLNNTAIRMLWVTTRPYDIQHELENILGTYSYTLEAFSKYDQELFLRSYCINKPKLADDILKYIDPGVQTILATPLHLFIIIKVFEKRFGEHFDMKIDLFNMYKQFIDITVRNIYLQEKSQLLNESNINVKRLIDKQCKQTIENHKILAVAALSPRDELPRILNKKEKKTLNELTESIKDGDEKAGLIDRVIDGMPRFVHITFAEYFIVIYFCDKLKAGSIPDVIWKLLVNNRNIRKFFDGILLDNRHLTELSLNCEVSRNIFELLFKHDESLLNIALKESLEHVVNFCSNIIKVSLDATNVSTFNIFDFNFGLVEGLYLKNKLSFILNMLEAPVFKNPQDQIGERSKLVLSILYCAIKYTSDDRLVTTLQSVLSKMVDIGCQLEEVFVNMYYSVAYLLEGLYLDRHKHYRALKEKSPHRVTCCTLIKAAIQRSCVSTLAAYLAELSEKKLVDIAKFSDSNGWLTHVHFAAMKKEFNFFYFFKKHLCKTNFRNICLITKINPNPPLYLLCHGIYENDNSSFEKYLSLYEYIFPSDDEDEEKFDVECLKNLYITAAKCKRMFHKSTTSFISKILDKVRRFCPSSRENEFEIGVTLVYHAVNSNNDIFIQALLQDVDDAERIIKIIMTRCDYRDDRTILHNTVYRDVNYKLLRLELLSSKQLLQVTTATEQSGRTSAHIAAKQQDLSFFNVFMNHLNNLSLEHLMQITIVARDDGWTPVHQAAKEKNFTFFNNFKKYLNRNNFRTICLAKNKCEKTTVPILFFAIDVNDERSVERYSSLCEYICPSEDEDEASFDKNILQNMYMVAATCKSLFKSNTGWFIKKMLNEVEYCIEDDIKFCTMLLYHAVAYNNEVLIDALLHHVSDADSIMEIMITKCDNGKTILHNAIDCGITIRLLRLELLRSEQLVSLATAADDQGWTPAHAAAQQDNMIFFDSFKYLLDALTPEQLVQIASVAARDGWTVAHKAAQGQHFVYFHYLKNRLNKNNFRAICLIKNESRQMPLLLLFSVINLADKELVEGYSSLCEHICPSDEEEQGDFDKDRLRDIYTIAATCKSIFIKNKCWFISKMLDAIKHYCDISSDDLEFGTKLLYCAIKNNNETVIHALLQDVDDADRIRDIMITKYENRWTLLDNIIRHGVNLKMLRLELLCPEQLVEVVTATGHRNWTPAHSIAQRDMTFLDTLNKQFGRLSPAQFVQVATVFDHNGATPAHMMTQRRDFKTFDLFKSYLDRLSPDQLHQVASVAGYDYITPVHLVAKKKYFDCIFYLQERLDKINFREICLNRTESTNETSIELLCEGLDLGLEGINNETVTKCMSVCGCIYPSDEEVESDIDEKHVESMYRLAAKYKILFERLRNTKFIKNMLDTLNKSRLNINDYHLYDDLEKQAELGGNDMLLGILCNMEESSDQNRPGQLYVT